MDQAQLDAHYQACVRTLEKLNSHNIKGPWQHEPHYLAWKHSGLDCLIVRNAEMFFLCGYVGVPSDHPYYGMGYDDVDDGLRVHGGLTYANAGKGIYLGPGDLWWLGFDCGHFQDEIPAMQMVTRGMRSGPAMRNAEPAWEIKYKTINFVEDQVDQLAEQLARLRK